MAVLIARFRPLIDRYLYYLFRILSTQQNSVSTVAKIAIVATLSRQAVDNSSR